MFKRIAIAAALAAAGLPAALFLLVGVAIGSADANTSLTGGPSVLALSDIPPAYLTLFMDAAQTCPGLPWIVLAGIGKVESDDGQSTAPGVHSGANYAGAEGPIQFEPATFAQYAVDADPGSTLSPYDPADAIYTAAAMLCANGAASGTAAGIRWIVENTATWWVQIPSADLSTERAVSHIQEWLLPITAAVAVGGVIAAGMRMAITRRANPLLDLGGGLLTLAAATALGATIAALLLKAGDAWSSWVLQASTGGHFAQRLNDILDLGGGAAPAVVLIFGVIAIIFALVQAVLMLFRQPEGKRLAALRAGRIHLFADPDGGEPLGSARALNWLEATASRGPRRYFLADGRWYEIGAAYIDSIRQQVETLISAAPSLDLPAWDPAQDERRYNQHVQDVRAGYLNLDRDLVRAGLHQATGFEACDLLGPDNELIHIKRARGSAPLSHLFSQALVSAQTLAYNPDALAEFTAKVRLHNKGRILPADFMPKKVIFGVMLKDGAPLTADTLFPFSQVTLAHTATELQARHQVTVEVIGIEADTP